MDAEEQGRALARLHEQMRLVTDDNVQLRDRSERLRSALGTVKDKMAQQAAASRDLSARLVQSQEEKLKISRDLVDVRIEANKMREKYETEIFELTNKMLYQEGVVSSLEAEGGRLEAEAESALARLRIAEGNERDMSEEYTALKSNFLALSDALEREITHSEELSDELLTLARTHDTLLRERERAYKHTLEVERVRALLTRVAHSRSRVAPEELVRVRGGAIKHTNVQPGGQNELREEIEKMRKSYEEVQRQLEEKIVAMGKEQLENRRATRNTQQELAQQSASLIISQYQLSQVEAENSKLQNHLKELNQEYRARLVRYIRDITECVQGASDSSVRLKESVDSMLKEVRESYRSREEQLTTAVRTYRKRLYKLSNTHQILLAAYRMQREQILSHTEYALEAGPPEADFSPGGEELKGETERELQKLRQDKARLETQLKVAQEQAAALSQPSHRAGLAEEMWTDIRKQLREITSTTQEAYERERVQLITRATVAEEQVSELQEYVDNHLGRYKLEVTRLQRLLGLKADRSQSAALPKLRPLHKSLKKSSYEI
ncbi:coiled-coil domain-containing protein 78 [Electrophorus electricus]|uniref:coiled-coil domain-containing protein 78 n=1 Tax=Electrophorus electricus TaxID=8005 RepID=UPI0015CFFBB4|nr:coiled-coil domain-containing protein 78 [Electrophorus electricus]